MKDPRVLHVWNRGGLAPTSSIGTLAGASAVGRPGTRGQGAVTVCVEAKLPQLVVTVAENCWLAPGARVAEAGLITTERM